MHILEAYFRDNYRRKCKMISYTLRGDPIMAEDVVQEAFEKAIRFQASFDEDRGSLDKWFNSILFNTLHDLQRKSRDVVIPVTDAMSREDVYGEEGWDNNPQLSNFVKKQVSAVENDKHKRVLHLFYNLGYTSAEISQIEQGVTQTNVTTIVMRFREGLK
jgi:RNA polymerase sigma factor (sigma-70 family)